MFFNNIKLSNFSLIKLGKTSNASKKIIKIKTFLPIQKEFKKLVKTKRNNAGRNILGRITVYSKGKGLLKRLPILNYNFRYNNILIYASFNYSIFSRRVNLLTYTSSGCVTYLPDLSNSLRSNFFNFRRLRPLLKLRYQIFNEIQVLKPNSTIELINFILLQQPKNTKICFLELFPLLGIKYTRSNGSKAFLLKSDTRTGLALVKLSSGIKKVFSIFSLSSLGSPSPNTLKKNLTTTKFGDKKKLGLKPKVRGVAKNPVDHPHGGRTKSIKYPRTP